MRVLLWVMVVLGIPCAAWLWIDFCTGPLLRWVRRRGVSSDAGSDLGRNGPAVAAPPRPNPPRGGER